MLGEQFSHGGDLWLKAGEAIFRRGDAQLRGRARGWVQTEKRGGTRGLYRCKAAGEGVAEVVDAEA